MKYLKTKTFKNCSSQEWPCDSCRLQNSVAKRGGDLQHQKTPNFNPETGEHATSWGCCRPIPPDPARSRPIPPDSARSRPIPPDPAIPRDSARFSPAPSKNTGVLANDGCGPIPPGPARSRPIPPDSARSRPILHALHDEKIGRTHPRNKKIRQQHPLWSIFIFGWWFPGPSAFWEFCCLKHGLAETQMQNTTCWASRSHIENKGRTIQNSFLLVGCDNAMWAFCFVPVVVVLQRDRHSFKPLRNSESSYREPLQKVRHVGKIQMSECVIIKSPAPQTQFRTFFLHWSLLLVATAVQAVHCMLITRLKAYAASFMPRYCLCKPQTSPRVASWIPWMEPRKGKDG